MFVIQDGRESFYQWDIDRKLIVKDSSIKEVHFCNKTEECSLVCATYQENGETLVNVPNILLTTDWKINVYGYTGDYTKHSACFKVVKRSKPTDYVYTETEVLNYQHLEEQINNIEESLNGYVNYEEFYTELDAALECYPTNDELWGNYYTKEEIEAGFSSKEPLIITVDGSTPSITNAEIYEAAQNGRAIFLYLWGNTYLKATYIAMTAVWFEASYLSVETINNKTYNVVKYRLFTIENNKFKQNNYNLPKVEYVADLEKRLAKYEKPYELIQSFTTTENTKLVELNGFELDKFALYLTTPITDSDGGFNIRVYKNTERVFSSWVNNAISKSMDNNPFGAFGKNENGIAFVEIATGSSSYKNKYTIPKYAEGINPFTKIEIVLSDTATYSIPTGAKLELWGVRANG